MYTKFLCIPRLKYWHLLLLLLLTMKFHSEKAPLSQADPPLIAIPFLFSLFLNVISLSVCIPDLKIIDGLMDELLLTPKLFSRKFPECSVDIQWGPKV